MAVAHGLRFKRYSRRIRPAAPTRRVSVRAYPVFAGEPAPRAERMKKICPVCERTFESKKSEKFCDDDCRETHRQQGHNPIQRHAALQRVLEKERIPYTDLLWKFDFYAELVKDGECLYCRGPLSRTGFALDRVDNSKPHFCWNAIIPACGRCNSTRSDLYTFEQMLILRPGLEQIMQLEKKEKK
jgi:hypothetical protein